MTSFDLNNGLLGTSLTIDQVRKTIIQTLNFKSDITDHKAEILSSGSGFTSYLIRIDLSWNPEDEKLPKRVIVKTLTSAKLLSIDSFQKTEQNILRLLNQQHNTESSAYELMNHLNDNPILAPIYYGGNRLSENETLEEGKLGFLILEDLSAQYVAPNLFKLMLPDDQQLIQVVQCLAIMHSWSLKHLDHIKSILAPSYFTDILFADNELQLDSLINTIKTDGLWSSLNNPTIMDSLTSRKFRVTHKDAVSSVNLNRQFGIPSTLCHGDVWANNLMFQKDDAGKPSGSFGAFVDWQIAHIGNPCDDLAHLVAVNIFPHQRSVVFRQQLLEAYYSEFKNELAKLNCQSIPFSMEQLINCYNATHLLYVKCWLPKMFEMVNVIRLNTVASNDTETKEKLIRLVINDTKLMILEIENMTK